MQPESFSTFFKLKNGPFLFKMLGGGAVIIVIALIKLYTDESISDNKLVGGSVGVVLVVDMIFFLMFMLPFLSYKRILQSNSSLVDDWKLFVEQRSNKFLSGKRYVKVSVSLQPSANATQEHREAIQKFLDRWQKEGESLHWGTWKKGSPDKFQVTEQTIGGHVAVGGGMSLLLRKIFAELPALLKVVDNQVVASLQFLNETGFEENLTHTARDEAREGELDRK